MSKSASPQQAPNGEWSFVVDLTPHPDGRRRQARRRGFKTKKEAQQKLDELRVSDRQGAYVAPVRQTVAEFLTEWLESVKGALKASTHASYCRNLRLHVIPRIGGSQLQGIDAGALNRLYGELAQPGSSSLRSDHLSPRTVRYIATILHRAFGDAVRWGRLQRNPADAATPPRAADARAPELTTWSAMELGQFLTATRGERPWSAWHFIATTGVRRGEALGLRWSDVDLEKATAVIRQTVQLLEGEVRIVSSTKSGKPRVISLSADTVEVLRTWRRTRAAEMLALGRTDSDGLMFPDPLGEPQQPNAFSQVFDRRVKRLALPKLSVHGLRHTWATLALEAGVHPKVVQEQLGHHSVAFTLDRYSHVTPRLASDGVEKVAALLARV